jgi:hypothetical protein
MDISLTPTHLENGEHGTHKTAPTLKCFGPDNEQLSHYPHPRSHTRSLWFPDTDLDKAARNGVDT